MGVRQRVVDFPRESLIQALGGKPGKPEAPPPGVDERLLQESAAGVLYGSSTPEEAKANAREYQRSQVVEWGSTERQRRSGELVGVQERRRHVAEGLAETERRLRSKRDKYIRVRLPPSEVYKQAWTLPVYVKAGFLVLAVAFAYWGGIVTISSTIQSNPAFHSTVKSFTIAGSFVVLPALALSLGYIALLKKSPDGARRFRKVLLVGVASSFVVAAASYALLYTDRGDPGTEIDLMALVEAPAAGSAGAPSELERRIFRYLPALFVLMLMMLDWCSASYCKTHLTDLIEAFGWPRLPAKQIDPEYQKEALARRQLSGQLAVLLSEEKTAAAFLRECDRQLEARASRLCAQALTRLAPMLDAVAHVRRTLPLIFPPDRRPAPRARRHRKEKEK